MLTQFAAATAMKGTQRARRGGADWIQKQYLHNPHFIFWIMKTKFEYISLLYREHWREPDKSKLYTIEHWTIWL